MDTRTRVAETKAFSLEAEYTAPPKKTEDKKKKRENQIP
jgi:hypothetical protein